MWIALLLIISLAGGYLYLTRPQRLAALTRTLLENMTGAEVEIGSARFGFDGTIHLSDVRLAVPEAPGSETRLFQVGEILIEHDLITLLRGKFTAQSLTLSKPTLYVTEYISPDDSAASRYLYEFLMQDDEDDDERELPTVLPEVYIRGGQIVTGEIVNNEYQPLYTLAVEGRLVEHEQEDETYAFSLHELAPETEKAPRISGSLNLRSMRLAVSGEDFVFGPGMSGALPREVRKWWSQLNPEGEFSSLAISYSEAGGFHGRMTVKGIALTLPYFGDKNELPELEEGEAWPLAEEQRNFRLTDVAGTFKVADKHITIENLEGNVENIRYTINGFINGFDRDAPFEMTVATDRFEVPAEPTFIPALPPVVQRRFDQFRPSGNFIARAKVLRKNPAGRISYDGYVRFSEAQLTYHKFPITISNAIGEITFNDNEINVREIKGNDPSGGEIVASGIIAPPGKDAAHNFEIKVTNIETSDHMLNAIPEKFRKPIPMFAHEAAFDELVEKGLINQQGSESPAFRLGGRTNLDIKATREYGEDKPVHIYASIDMEGLGLIFKHWPYPVVMTGGKLHISPGQIRIEDITGRGLRGGEMIASGRVDIPKNEEGDRDVIPHIAIRATGAPFDDLMLYTIPARQKDWLTQLNVTGTIDAKADIFRDENKDAIAFSVATHLREGTARPFGKSFHISDLTGNIVIESDRILIDQMQGKRSTSTLSVAGYVQRVEESRWTFQMDFKADQLDLSGPVADLIPPTHEAHALLNELYATYKPEGLIDAHLTYAGGDDQKDRYRLMLHPKALAFDYKNRRVQLTDMEGTVALEPGRMSLNQVSAKFESGAFHVDGYVLTEGSREMKLRFNAQSEELDPFTRSMLPGGVLQAVEGLSFNGRYVLNHAQLHYRPPQEATDDLPAVGSMIAFEGDIDLSGASADVGVELTEIDANLFMTAHKSPDDEYPDIDLDVHATRLKAVKRFISPLDLRIQSRRHDLQQGILDFNEFTGNMYGGLLLGSGSIDLRQQGKYLFELALLDAPLDPVLYPEKFEDQVKTYHEDPREAMRLQKQMQQSGRISASLNVQSDSSRPAAKRGRGAIAVRDGQMYRQPVSFAILHLFNLSAPSAAAFDQSDVRFLIDGDTVLFDLISISAPSVEIRGDGTMQFSTKELNLHMHSRNPRSWNLGPVSDFFKTLRDELIAVQITGTIDQPVTRVQSFRGFSNSWNAIFGGKVKRDSRHVSGNSEE